MGLSDLIESLKRKAMSCDWLTDRMYNKKSKREAVSSNTDGNQLATGNKKRRLVKGVNKEEEGEEEEAFIIMKEEEIEDDLHQDTDEDSRKPSAVVKEEEDVIDVKDDGEGTFQLDNDEFEDSRKPPNAIKEEEGYGYETDEEAYGYETEENDDRDDVLLWGNNEREDSKKPSAVVKKEVEDEVGHEYSPREIDGKSYWEQLPTREENDDEAIYLPDEITSTKGLFPPTSLSDTDTSVAATPVPIVQVSSARAPNPADEKPAALGRGHVCNENTTLSEGTDQPGSTPEKDKSTKIRAYATRSRSNANIVKKKYSLRSLSHENNKRGARSKSLRKKKRSPNSLGEANRSPMASTDEDEFGRDIKSTIVGASDTSDSVDGMVDQDDVILGVHHLKWNRMYRRLRAYKKSHGDCELFGAVDRFAFILNTPANTLPSLSPCIVGKVPTRYSLDTKLATWVDTQRSCFKNGIIDVDRKEKLDEIGFTFSVKFEGDEENWSLQFKKLQDYYVKHGHCELFLAVDRTSFILNTPTNTTPSSRPALQVK
jgi:hypothetical protein